VRRRKRGAVAGELGDEAGKWMERPPARGWRWAEWPLARSSAAGMVDEAAEFRI
jgi:hypothetical protein